MRCAISTRPRATYAQLIEIDPKHRTAWFNLGVCQGHERTGSPPSDSFRKAVEIDATRVRRPARSRHLPDP